MDMGLIGAIFGVTIGVLSVILGPGPAITTDTKTPAGRFAIKYNIGVWVGLILLIGLPLPLSLTGIMPIWLYWVTFALFFILLLPANVWANKCLLVLRDEGA